MTTKSPAKNTRRPQSTWAKASGGTGPAREDHEGGPGQSDERQLSDPLPAPAASARRQEETQADEDDDGHDAQERGTVDFRQNQRRRVEAAFPSSRDRAGSESAVQDQPDDADREQKQEEQPYGIFEKMPTTCFWGLPVSVNHASDIGGGRQRDEEWDGIEPGAQHGRQHDGVNSTQNRVVH